MAASSSAVMRPWKKEITRAWSVAPDFEVGAKRHRAAVDEPPALAVPDAAPAVPAFGGATTALEVLSSACAFAATGPPTSDGDTSDATIPLDPADRLPVEQR